MPVVGWRRFSPRMEAKCDDTQLFQALNNEVQSDRNGPTGRTVLIRRELRYRWASFAAGYRFSSEDILDY